MKVTPSSKPPQWKIALWARDSIEPAMLRVPLIILLFIALWGTCLWLLDRSRIPYHPVLSIKSSSYLTFLGLFTIGFTTLYSLDITVLSGMSWTIEQSIATFYFLAVIIYFIPIFPGDECRMAFNRLFRSVFWPGPTIAFPEVLLADAMCSISKVLKDFGTTLVAIYA
eukprot:gene14170-15669_t